MNREPHSASRSFSPTKGEKLALGLAGVAILWLIMTRTLASYLAVVDPELALILQPGEPRALIMRAEADLNRALSATQLKGSLSHDAQDALEEDDTVGDHFVDIARVAVQTQAASEVDSLSSSPTSTAAPLRPFSQEELDQIRRFATLSIEARPVNADAMSLLARLAEATGERDRTRDLMTTALRLSVRESYAAYWLLLLRLDQNDVAGALNYADILLRTRSSSMPYVAPRLASIAESPNDRHELAALLATNPPWRFTFLARLLTNITDARTPLFQYLALKETAAPPSKEEIALYLNFLASKKFFDLSYYTWLQLKSPDELAAVTPVHNGSFEQPIDGSPFDWSISSNPAVRSVIAAHPSRPGQKALTIEFRGNRASDPAVRQVLHLPPGGHTLTGNYASALLGPRGLVWHIGCLNGNTIGSTEVLRGSAPGWKPFSAGIVVPTENCRLQEITLAVDRNQATERFVSGSIWFDDLAIVRGESLAQEQANRTSGVR